MAAASHLQWRMLALTIAGLLPANFIILHQWLHTAGADDEAGNRHFAAAYNDAAFVLPQKMNADIDDSGEGEGHNAATFRHQVDGDDLSWLQHVKVGEFLGSGKYSDTFAAAFDNDYHKRYTPQTFTETGKPVEYIIRVTGNYHDGAINDKKLRVSQRAWNITQRLSPHPSIPTMMHYVRRTPNPFNDGRLQFADDGKWKWAKKHIGGRLLKATAVSIDVTERVRASVKHYDPERRVLTVPPHMVRCFWRQLFEIMSYVHSKGVSVRDTKLWNFMIRAPGRIVLFDFNLGHMVKIGSTEYKRIHEHDVQHFGKRIQEYVESQKDDTATAEKLSQVDLEDLEDVSKIMMNESEPPPTMTALLNHEYFLVEADDECLLKW